METATGLAERAANEYFERGLLGVTVVVLCLVIGGLLLFIRSLLKENKRLETEWRADLRAYTKELTEATATMERQVSLTASRGRVRP